MINSLPNLHHSSPNMRGKLFLTILTLGMIFYKLCDKRLLNHSLNMLFLNCNFDFYSFRMRLGPDKTSIYELYPIESFNFFKA